MAKGGRKKSGRLFIILALVLILILAVVAFLMRDRHLTISYCTSSDGEVIVQEAEETVDIVVLTQPVARGDAISDDMLEMIPIPRMICGKGSSLPSARTLPANLPKTDLVNGMPLTMNSLTDIPLGPTPRRRSLLEWSPFPCRSANSHRFPMASSPVTTSTS